MEQCKTCENDFECLSCFDTPVQGYLHKKLCDSCVSINSEIKFINDFEQLAITLNNYNPNVKTQLNLSRFEL